METPELKPNEWAIRCDCLETSYDDMKKAYHKAFEDVGHKIVGWFCAYEVSKEKKKPHWHMYINTEGQMLVKFETFSGKFNEKLKQYIPQKGNQKNLQKLQSFDNYLPYISKDLDIKEDYTIDKALVDKIIEQTKKINDDKKKSSSLKVYEALDLEKIDTVEQFTEQVLNIYEEQWNKDPPQPHVMKKHLIYYLKKKGDFNNITKLYGFNNIIL